MSLQSIVDQLVTDTLEISIPLFAPELVLCATIVLLLLVRLFPLTDRIDPFFLAAVGSLIALWYALPPGGLDRLADIESQELFTGMLIFDGVTVFIRCLLLFFAVLFVVLSLLTGLADRDDGQDYYVLVLGATLGMCVMASANHMITVFLGVEMASVPSYVLAGVVKGRRRSSEAALKYAIYGAGAAGVMVYGISLICGVLGTAHLPTIAQRLALMNLPEMIASGEDNGTLMALALGGLMLSVGLAFKLSAVPFHFWCPDVFEGASAEVDAFLSVASKAAALVLLVRVVFGIGNLPDVAGFDLLAAGNAPAASETLHPDEASSSMIRARFAAVDSDQMRNSATVSPIAQPVSRQDDRTQQALSPVRNFIVYLLAIVSAVTCTFGNLAAYGQTNIKRMLAYSTIAHAGYMMMPVAAAVTLLGSDTSLARDAVSALLVYAALYLFMNLGAFSIVAFLRNAMRSEQIADYGGLIRSCPLLAVAMTLILVSLVGLPPLAGFIGKFAIFRPLVVSGDPLLIFLLVVAGLNTAASLVYYLRVARTMCIDPEPLNRGPIEVGTIPATYVALVTLPVLYYGVFPDRLLDWAHQAGLQLFL